MWDEVTNIMLNETIANLTNTTQPALNLTLNLSNLQPPAAAKDWILNSLTPTLTGYGITLNLAVLLLYAMHLALGPAKYVGGLRGLTNIFLTLGVLLTVINNFIAIPHLFLYILLGVGFIGEIAYVGLVAGAIFLILAFA